MSGAFLQDTAALSLYAVGKLTGCVVDMGHGKVDIVPVSEGQAQSHGMQRLPLAGEDMTKHIQEHISKSDDQFQTPLFPKYVDCSGEKF